MDIWAHGLRFPETGAWLCYTRCHGQVQSFWQMYRPRVLPGYQQTFPHWYTKGILSDSGVCVNLWHRKQKHLLKTQMQQHTLICIGNKSPVQRDPLSYQDFGLSGKPQHTHTHTHTNCHVFNWNFPAANSPVQQQTFSCWDPHLGPPAWLWPASTR